MFPAYVDHPLNCIFEGQDPDEEILLLLRAHPITNVPWIVFAIAVFIFPFFINMILPFTGLNLNLIPFTFQLVYLIINYLLVLTITFEGFLNWYFNVSLITNHKIVDIDFDNLLYKGVNLAPLDKIEEADSITAGLVGTFLNFGNVSVQTAGAKVAIEMKNVPHAAHVADMVLDLAHKKRGHIPAPPII